MQILQVDLPAVISADLSSTGKSAKLLWLNNYILNSDIGRIEYLIDVELNNWNYQREVSCRIDVPLFYCSALAGSGMPGDKKILSTAFIRYIQL